jgi:virginiamycin B lyase
VIPTAGSDPFDITVGPDGNLWFLEENQSIAENVGRVTPGGVITEFPAGGLTSYIAAGPDGNLWFSGSEVVRMTTAGALLSAFPLRHNLS